MIKNSIVFLLLVLGIGLSTMQAQQRIKVDRLPIDTYHTGEGDEDNLEEPTGSDLGTARTSDASASNDSSAEDNEGEESGGNGGGVCPASTARIAIANNHRCCKKKGTCVCAEIKPCCITSCGGQDPPTPSAPPTPTPPPNGGNSVGVGVGGSCDNTNDVDNDGILDCYDTCDDRVDTDGDGISDCIDTCDDRVDADGDGLSDCIDNCDDRIDLDNDGTADCIDPCVGTINSCGTCIHVGGTSTDSDGDNTPDECDKCLGHDDRIDTDSDGTPDACDKCPGHDDRVDADSDGKPDACDPCPNFDGPINCAGKCEAEPKCGCDGNGNENPDPDSKNWTPDDLKDFLRNLSPEMENLMNDLPQGTTIGTHSDKSMSNTTIHPCNPPHISIQSDQSFVNAVGSLAFEVTHAANKGDFLDAVNNLLSDPNSATALNDFLNAMYLREAKGSINKDKAKEQIRDTKAPCGNNQTPPSQEGSGEDPNTRATRFSQQSQFQNRHLKNFEILTDYAERNGEEAVNKYNDCN